MNLQGLDDRIAQKITQEYGLKTRGPVLDLPFEVLLLAFIILSAVAGFILGYNWYRIFKAKTK